MKWKREYEILETRYAQMVIFAQNCVEDMKRLLTSESIAKQSKIREEELKRLVSEHISKAPLGDK